MHGLVGSRTLEGPLDLGEQAMKIRLLVSLLLSLSLGCAATPNADIEQRLRRLEELHPTPTATRTPAPTLTQAEREALIAATEHRDVSTGITALMTENGLSSIPNPVSANTSPCTTGTQAMDAFPDTESDDGFGGGADGGKVNDMAAPAVAYDFDGTGGDDKQGYVLFGHDFTADSSATGLINYVNFNSTRSCFTVAGDGTVQAHSEDGRPLAL